MYQSGTYVIYGIQGVCRVVGTEVQRVNRKRTEFLVLEPLAKTESRFYLPLQNAAAMEKLKPVMSRDELVNLLVSPDIRQGNWISEENRRKQYYRELVTGYDRMALLQMLSSLYRYKDEQLAFGRKFHQCDDNFMRDAERILSVAVALTMELTVEEARHYLKEKIA